MPQAVGGMAEGGQGGKEGLRASTCRGLWALFILNCLLIFSFMMQRNLLESQKYFGSWF